MAYKILTKKILNPQIFMMEVEAPLVARKAEPGQFIILRTNEYGERVPFTIADFDREKGTVIGGGLGTAIAYPQAKKLHSLGADVTVITGFRNKELIILEDELKAVSNKLIITTDDGSNGLQGFVTDRLKEQIEAGEKFDKVIAIGPLVMMRAVCNLTKQYDIPTVVSMNPVMIDGTGMCGGCRVIVDGETKFACVDGPDFDGHKIDWQAALNRQNMFKTHEKTACEEGKCRIGRSNNA